MGIGELDASTEGNTAAEMKNDIPIFASCGIEEEESRGASSTIAMMRKKTRRKRRMFVTSASIICCEIIENSRWVYPTRLSRRNRPRRTRPIRIAAIFGTKLRVCSWMEVVAWRMATIRPTAIAIRRIGPAIRSVSSTPSRTS